MIPYKEFELANGLKVLVNEDPTTPMAVVNVLYNVGSKDEIVTKTGFAHLFEHFMFEGSKHVANFDSELQLAGGENNAFTTNDLTNYYESLPANNLETAFWLESDRMLELNFNQESLDTQISVVCEEFKENYINKPYGDMYHLLTDMSYKVHPYKWPTIGLKLEHIQAFTMDEVKDFFYKYYRPNNAILTVCGGVQLKEVKRLTEKWFGDIPRGPEITRSYSKEPKQLEKRHLEVHRDVPVDALYMAFHICDRLHQDYYATDLLSDLLGSGNSSRMHQKLVREEAIFSELYCDINGSDEAGLLIIDGKLNTGIDLKTAEAKVWEVLQEMQASLISDRELKKVVNKTINYMSFSNENIVNRAFNLAYFKMIDKLEWVNNEKDAYYEVKNSDIQRVAKSIFEPTNCNTLHYHANAK